MAFVEWIAGGAWELAVRWLEQDIPLVDFTTRLQLDIPSPPRIDGG